MWLHGLSHDELIYDRVGNEDLIDYNVCICYCIMYLIMIVHVVFATLIVFANDVNMDCDTLIIKYFVYLILSLIYNPYGEKSVLIHHYNWN